MSERAEIWLLEWLDAAASAPHWEDGTKPVAPTQALVQSVGFVTNQTDDSIQLLQTTSEDSHMHAINIPRRMIVSITLMRYGKKERQ